MENSQQELLDKRLAGQLPEIDILGHTFYVDLRMGSLRPKDDFFTEGIKFDDIENYAQDKSDTYQITYNPKTHSFEEINVFTISSIPNNIVVIEIPVQVKLDPVGYSRMHGHDINSFIKNHPIQENMKARLIPWKDTGIENLIVENKKKELKKQESKSPNKPKMKRRKGKRILK